MEVLLKASMPIGESPNKARCRVLNSKTTHHHRSCCISSSWSTLTNEREDVVKTNDGASAKVITPMGGAYQRAAKQCTFRSGKLGRARLGWKEIPLNHKRFNDFMHC